MPASWRLPRKHFAGREEVVGLALALLPGEATLLCGGPSFTISGMSLATHPERPSQDLPGQLCAGGYAIMVVA